MDLKRGIDKAVAAVVESIKSQSQTVGDNFEKIEQVAAISANNDAEIGKHIADAMQKVSKDGVITIEEAKGRETYIDVVEGMQFDRGYLSSYFVTDAEKMHCVMENPQILIHDKKISNLKDMLPILDRPYRPVVPCLSCRDVDSRLDHPVVNRLRSGLKICAVKAPDLATAARKIVKILPYLQADSW